MCEITPLNLNVICTQCVCAVTYPGGVYYSLEAAIFPFLKGEIIIVVCGRSAI